MRPLHLLTSCAALASGTSLGTRAMSCHDISIPVTAHANNKNLSKALNMDDLTAPLLSQIAHSSAEKRVGGHYTIHGRYCEPANHVESRHNTLQVLVHGITYTVDYWSGLAAPGTKAGQDEYSWNVYASKQGYPTLAVDRLCNGGSSRPNGLMACQVPLEAEVMHGVIEAARSGKVPGVGRKFSKIIYVGHSYGSLVANNLAVRHPEDADAWILTGYSRKLALGAYGVVVRPTYLPANQVKPKQFGNLKDPNYIIATNLQGALSVFYHGKYKKSESQYDWNHRQTVTDGEFATALIGQKKAPGVKAPVFVLNGNEDNIFCSTLQSTTVGNAGNCTNGYSEGVKSGYPNARAFGFFNTPHTGHCLNTHTTAQQSFKAAHDFMNKQGF